MCRFSENSQVFSPLLVNVLNENVLTSDKIRAFSFRTFSIDYKLAVSNIYSVQFTNSNDIIFEHTMHKIRYFYNAMPVPKTILFHPYIMGFLVVFVELVGVNNNEY